MLFQGKICPFEARGIKVLFVFGVSSIYCCNFPRAQVQSKNRISLVFHQMKDYTILPSYEVIINPQQPRNNVGTKDEQYIMKGAE